MARRKRNADKQETAEKTWRVAVYIRLSREDGNTESESVTNQKKILTEYLEEYFNDKFELADFYIDDGLSGTDDSRKDFMRMIKDIEDGRVNCIVCKTLSRAFRNYSDQGYYLEYYFPQKQVRFISTGDPKIDTFTEPEVLLGLEVPITGLMNDRYAAKTSSDIRRTFATKRRNGEFIGAFPPYGYLKDPNNKNHLILDENIIPIKKEIYYWIVGDGMSLRGAAKKLNDLGVPNPTSYKASKGWNYFNPNSDINDGLWTGQTVRRVLLDKVNLGHMVQGKQRVVSYKVHDKVAVPEDEWIIKENTHEPTFTQDEYNRLERLLLRDTRTADDSRTLHLFSGFMRCFDCNKALERRSAKGYVYYACRTYTDKSDKKCTKHSIREDVLYNCVLAVIQLHVNLLDSLADIVDETLTASNTKHIEKLIADKNRESAKYNTALDSLYMDWKTGEITETDYRRLKNKFETSVNQINEDLCNLFKEQKEIIKAEDNSFFDEWGRHKNFKKITRGVLAELVENVYVHECREISIVFCFNDGLKD
ncbi:MAG: recombinase family protein [Ruminococcus sp.]|jgi:DNA invertase Pin-like site-specific DNA recombinase|nr:recombinase family protein [Ruminococcus sp.]